MSVAQTLPNIQTYPLWASVNEQSNNVQYTLECSQVQLTSAQLLALKTTAIQVTPTPSPGQTLWVDSIALRLDFNSIAYTLNAGNLEFFYGPPANGHNITPDLSTNFVTAAASRMIVNVPTLIVAADTFANIQQQPIFIGNTGTANYTAGNSTITVTLMFGRTTP